MRIALALTLALTGAPAMASAAHAAEPASARASGHIRVDQVGFAPGEAKHAYLMTSGRPAPFAVIDHRGRQVLKGTAGRDLGAWNARYGHVYDLDLTRLRRAGTYRIVSGGLTSARFTIAPSAQLAQPASKIVTFFGGQRDGGRRHANDRATHVYDWPTFTGPDTDQIKGELTKVGGPVDVEGGWFDAGDYLKFTHILAYVDTLMWAARRDGGASADPRLKSESLHGLKYLDKMWDGASKTLYIQVGIGAGNAEGTFAGDHDLWRLPESDDSSSEKYIRNRPVFRAAAPGQPISPNLAGRTAAAFALAAQVEPNRRRAQAWLDQAAEIYAMAKTTDVGQLVTSLPHAFYPESVWRDDMELGGAELALAGQRLGDSRAGQWLEQAQRWATEYIAGDTGDTLNLYDVSALAHADLIRAGASIKGALVADLRAQLEIGASRAAKDPFRAGARYDAFDSVPHAFGLAATSRLYRAVSGDRSYDAFGTQQRGWALGANAWGVSFVQGVGDNSIACPHYQISNLTGRPATGAVVNGPNAASLFDDGLGGHFEEMAKCPADQVDRYEEFTGRGSRFVDDVRSWQASEPADDFAAIGLYALTLMARD
ncbi:glycoside hydrolase family 9 protein [Nonomuraea sp. NPDC059194]|uniref:glycoside hydrolase family 9 protein n=1 Tax=Nonomuraea sp. NPDC059194 TaxID=3346764 RepID=UPI0036BA5121